MICWCDPFSRMEGSIIGQIRRGRATTTHAVRAAMRRLRALNRTIKDATVKRYYYDSHCQLRTHLADFLAAYNFALRLMTLNGCQPIDNIDPLSASQSDCRGPLQANAVKLVMPAEDFYHYNTVETIGQVIERILPVRRPCLLLSVLLDNDILNGQLGLAGDRNWQIRHLDLRVGRQSASMTSRVRPTSSLVPTPVQALKQRARCSRKTQRWLC